jgi:hypothetical protein
MKRSIAPMIPVTMLLVGIAFNCFAGPRTIADPRTESLLSAAGFQIRTGQDARQEEWYGQTPATAPNTIERHGYNGHVVYTYVDRGGDFMYIGGEPEYRQYERLVTQVSINRSRIEAAEAGDQSWREWRWTWKPWLPVKWSYQPTR